MDLLTVFKFAGILVSGALGILGTLTETRDKTTGRLTRWGNWALRLTIAGFATALCAQIAESLKNTHEDTESRKHTELQLQQASNVLQRLEEQGHQNQTILTTVQHQSLVAQSSLDSIQKVATRFDTIYVSMFAELPATNQFRLCGTIRG
jgi:hypothetical protein